MDYHVVFSVDGQPQGHEQRPRAVGLDTGETYPIKAAGEEGSGALNLLPQDDSQADPAEDEDFEEKCLQILTMMLAEACKSFERLPLVEYASILRNILYSGVWCRYELTNQKRKDKKTNV